MNQHEESNYDSWPKTHEYPDPDYAAYAIRYPWAGTWDDYTQVEQPDEPDSGLHGLYQRSPRSDQSDTADENTDAYIHEITTYPGGEASVFDPDYLLSDVAASEDDIISDGDSTDSTERREVFRDPTVSLRSVAIGQRGASRARRARARGSGGRGRRGGLGRGGKGFKRGLRTAMEPTEEFKALHSQATIAFIDQDYEEAESLTLQAIHINPEMYPAHNLLSEIHAARGDDDRAISAAWAGAHTRHRDPEIWSRTARLILERDSNDRKSTLRGAIYCVNRIINLDKYNVEARYQRATLYHELGHKGKAAVEYEELFKQLPHDTTVLRHLAEIYIELEKPKAALKHYESTISFFQTIEPDGVSGFTWSDVNIVTELYGFQERYEEGMIRLKSLSRWLLGRSRETYWDTFNQDDREWDLDDQPRRAELPEFLVGEYDSSSYGESLPLELRIKLGVFRLKAQTQDLEEAINHFEWLEPDDNEAGARLHDYPDLFREAGNALCRTKHFHEALRYYEPLQKSSDYVDTSYLSELASCYKAVGLTSEAKDCYNMIVDSDNGNREARRQLVELDINLGAVQRENTNDPQAASTKQHKSRRQMGDKISRRPKKKTVLLQSPSSPMLLAPRPAHDAAKQHLAEQVQVQEEKLDSLFIHYQSLSQKAFKGDKNSKSEWMSITRTLLQGFRDNRVFYPIDKHHKFYGYSKEARTMASRPKYETNALVESSGSIYETSDGNRIVVPDNYCDIRFEIWLDIFLEYALELALCGAINLAYETISSAFHANVFFHSPRALFLIHVCWFTCALVANDDETLCNIARWFIKEYQFVSDGYRLFSVLNKLCDSENSWYNCGPSQKYILRQLKAMDFSLLDKTPQKSVHQEQACYTTKDNDGNQRLTEDMDVTLLMLYGNILHAGKSYAYAVNYYLRALALDPRNPMIILSLALGYIHYALKRQAGNRHHILMQGFAFLFEYHDERALSVSHSEQQEAAYNVAHAYHLVGLTHLAVPYYEKCLDLSLAVQAESQDHQIEDFALEAAANLQGVWAASGNMEKARDVTEKWMVFR